MPAVTGRRSGVQPHAGPLAATLSFAVCVGLFPPFALGALSPFIIPDLGLSRALYGALGTAAFTTAAVLSPVAGIMVDRLGARRALVALFVAATAAWTVAGLAGGYAQLAFAVCLAGVPKALANPATTSMILQTIAPSRRARFVGFAQTGPPIAGLLAGFVLPSGALALGWRPTLLAFAACGAAGAVSTLIFIRPRSPAARRGSTTGDPGGRLKVEWGLAGYAFLINTAIVPVLVYAPLYAFQQLSWTESAAALLTGVAGVTSLAGRILWTAGRPGAPAVSTRMVALPLVSALSVVMILAAAPAQASWMLWLGVAAFGASATTWTALTMLAVMMRSTELSSRAGRAAGYVMLLGFLGGAVGPLLFGAVVDSAGSYVPAWTIALVALLATAGVGIVDARRSSRQTSA